MLPVVALVAGLLVGGGVASGRQTMAARGLLTPRVLVASGTQDGVLWSEYAWIADLNVCVEVDSGGSASECGGVPRFDLPFVSSGETPVVTRDASAAAMSEIVFGIVSDRVARIKVLGQSGQPLSSHLTRCPCAGSPLWASGFYSAAATQKTAAKSADGYSVTVIAYDASGLEAARIRVLLINLGYCPSPPCGAGP
jgi:hypothetical protein